MGKHIFKSHNKTFLLYHMVFPAKYRKKIFDDAVDKTLKEVCLEISERYEIYFLEIGNDVDHVHFLVQTKKVRVLGSRYKSELSVEGAFANLSFDL